MTPNRNPQSTSCGTWVIAVIIALTTTLAPIVRADTVSLSARSSRESRSAVRATYKAGLAR